MMKYSQVMAFSTSLCEEGNRGIVFFHSFKEGIA